MGGAWSTRLRVAHAPAIGLVDAISDDTPQPVSPMGSLSSSRLVDRWTRVDCGAEDEKTIVIGLRYVDFKTPGDIEVYWDTPSDIFEQLTC